MLDIFGDRYGSCDGVSRRNFLRVGALGLGGFDAARTCSGTPGSRRLDPDLGEVAFEQGGDPGRPERRAVAHGDL